MKNKLTEKQKIKQHNQELRDYQLKHQGFLGTVYKKSRNSRWIQVIYKDGKIIN